VLREYGELNSAGRIARRIHEAAQRDELATVGDLVKIANALARGEKRNQFLAKVWQALRIWVNDELAQVEMGLGSSVRYLRPGGVLAVISFHSLEDRMVKNFLSKQEDPCTCPKGLPQCICGKLPTMARVTKKAIKPSEAEIRDNPRSRSARLRAASKLRVN
jgi:16S rRNA (cytosine1402-N4)-methyltransferase